ncbi:MAG: hypothetical protein U9Q77_05810 [Candidatus Marinimicrobia bacterium]|nr:hypothetical protein [Candidatus Neomarinimicrobiota bacterium]
MELIKIDMSMSLVEYRRLALMSLWTGLIVTVGIVCSFIPNLELVILSAFLGGVALGPKRGFIVAVIGEAVFSTLNPIGSGLGYPILLLFQVVGIGIGGGLGGLLAPAIRSLQHPIAKAVALGVTGFVITLIYDVLTALSFPLSSGMVEGTLWGTIVTGLVFFIMHITSNTILFALFAPILVRLVDQQLLMHDLRKD